MNENQEEKKIIIDYVETMKAYNTIMEKIDDSLESGEYNEQLNTFANFYQNFVGNMSYNAAMQFYEKASYEYKLNEELLQELEEKNILLDTIVDEFTKLVKYVKTDDVDKRFPVLSTLALLKSKFNDIFGINKPEETKEDQTNS